MKNRTPKSAPIVVPMILLLMFITLSTSSCGGRSEESTSNTESNQVVDICKCLTEPGNSPYMIENREACRDAISREVGVDNWEKVNMSRNPEVSRKFDELAARCTTLNSESTNSIPSSERTAPSAKKQDCIGNQNCIGDVRRLVNGAGYEIADERYEGEGIFYIAAFKYGPGEPINITYVMDCDCKPVDIKIGNSVRTNSSSEKLHRCGRSWTGTLYEGGVYGDYCGLECYADNYPN